MTEPRPSPSRRPVASRRPTLALFLALVAVATVLAGCSSSPTSPGPSPSTRLVYAAIGASDAVGVGAFPLTDGYVYKLADRMRTVRSEVVLHNQGINGAKLDQFLAEELEPAITANPDVVTIWAGPNDIISGRSPETFAAQLDTLLGELGRRTRALVFVADIPDLTRCPYFRLFPDPDVTVARVDAFNARIAAAVAAHGAVVVRLSTDLAIDSDLFSIDGFHPSNQGHARIAGLFWAQIAPRL